MKQASPLIALWVITSTLLALGLCRPVIQISVNIESVLKDAVNQQPIIGLILQEKGLKLSELVTKLPPATSTKQSILSSTTKLYRSKSYIAVAMILLFSIALPIAKQIAFLVLLLRSNGGSSRLLVFIKTIHKWAMLDVFVLAMVVVALSSASAWTATLLDGFLWFLAYFFAAAILGAMISAAFPKMATQPNATTLA